MSQVKSLSLCLDWKQCPKMGVAKDYWYLLTFAWGPEKRRPKVLGLSDVESCTAGSGAKFAKQTLINGVWIQFGSLRLEMNNPFHRCHQIADMCFRRVCTRQQSPSVHKTINLYCATCATLQQRILSVRIRSSKGLGTEQEVDYNWVQLLSRYIKYQIYHEAHRCS